MKIKDLSRQLVAVYAGRFHPFHIGHAMAFNELQAKFGAESTYIATSGKVEPPKSPFSFEEKLVMISAAGIDAGRVFQETVPYAPLNLPQALKLDPAKDVLIFGVGSKDMAEDPRFNFAPLKNGTPSYFQPLKGNENNLKPFSNDKLPDGTRAGHGYVFAVKDYKFNVAGQTAGSASDIRNRFVAGDAELRQRIVADLYPNASPGDQARILKIFESKLGADK